MATIKRFEYLEIWQMAREICKQIYAFTQRENFNKSFRQRDQILASSGSIMDNIAEGFDRGGSLEFINFLTYAKGSAAESKSQLYRAFDCNYISQLVLDDMCERIEKCIIKIAGFIFYLNKSNVKGTKFKDRIEKK